MSRLFHVQRPHIASAPLRLVAPLLLVLPLCLLASAHAQVPDDQARLKEVSAAVNALFKGISAVQEDGYRFRNAFGAYLGILEPNRPYSESFALTRGRKYAFIGTSETGTSELTLELRDENGRLLASEKGTGRAVVIYSCSRAQGVTVSLTLVNGPTARGGGLAALERTDPVSSSTAKNLWEEEVKQALKECSETAFSKNPTPKTGSPIRSSWFFYFLRLDAAEGQPKRVLLSPQTWTPAKRVLAFAAGQLGSHLQATLRSQGGGIIEKSDASDNAASVGKPAGTAEPVTLELANYGTRPTYVLTMVRELNSVQRTAGDTRPFPTRQVKPDPAVRDAVTAAIQARAKLSAQVILDGVQGRLRQSTLDAFMDCLDDSYHDRQGRSKEEHRRALIQQFKVPLSYTLVDLSYTPRIISLEVLRNGNIQADVEFQRTIESERNQKQKLESAVSREKQEWTLDGGRYRLVSATPIGNPTPFPR